MTTADLLVINKTDLAPMVGADLTVMSRDAAAVREGRPVLFTSIREDRSAHMVAQWVTDMVDVWRHEHGVAHHHGDRDSAERKEREEHEEQPSRPVTAP